MAPTFGGGGGLGGPLGAFGASGEPHEAPPRLVPNTSTQLCCAKIVFFVVLAALEGLCRFRDVAWCLWGPAKLLPRALRPKTHSTKP